MKQNKILLFFVMLLLMINLSYFVQASCVGSTYTFNCGDTINQSCTLNSNEATTGNCYTISSSNIVISGNNYILDSDATDGIGFNISNVDNITIQNITFTDFGSSVYVNNNKNLTLKNIISNKNISVSNSWFGNYTNISTNGYSELTNVSRTNITDMKDVIIKDTYFDGLLYPSNGNNYEYKFTRVNNTLFINHTTINSKGLVSYWYGDNLTVKNSRLENITSTAGSAIYFTDNILFENNSFYNVSYTTSWSQQNDAIYISGGSGTKKNINNVTIFNNIFNLIGHWDTIFIDSTNISDINISNNNLSKQTSQYSTGGGIVFYYSTRLTDLLFNNNIGSTVYYLSTPSLYSGDSTFINNSYISYIQGAICFQNITDNEYITMYNYEITACNNAMNISNNNYISLNLTETDLDTLEFNDNTEIENLILYQNETTRTTNLDFGSIFGYDLNTVELYILGDINVSNLHLNNNAWIYGNATYYKDISQESGYTLYDYSWSNISNISVENYYISPGYDGWEVPTVDLIKNVYDSEISGGITTSAEFGDIKIYNTTVNLFSNTLTNNATVSQYWYIESYVNDSLSNPLEDADVIINTINRTTITLDIQEPIGLALYENIFYVVDDLNGYLYEYDLDGGQYIEKFYLENISYPFNLAVNENYIYVVGTEAYIKVYNHDGEFITQYETSSSGASSPRGISLNETNIFIVDRLDAEVYIYYLNGTYTGNHFDTSVSGNTAPRGITNDGTYFWIVDLTGKKIYKYYMNGTYTGSYFDTIPFGNYFPYGIAIESNDIYIVDYYDKYIYNYLTNGQYAYNYIDIGISHNNTYSTYETLQTDSLGFTDTLIIPSFFESSMYYMEYNYNLHAKYNDESSNNYFYVPLNNQLVGDNGEINLTIKVENSCVGEHSSFYCGDTIYEDCTFNGDITCSSSGFTLDYPDININGNGYTLSTTGSDSLIINSGMVNNNITDLIIDTSSGYDIYFDDSSESELSLYNCSFDKDNIEFHSTSTSILNVFYYLDVYVFNTIDNPVDDATVYIIDNQGTITNYTTDDDGYIDRQTLLEFTEIVTGKTWYSNYTIYSTKLDYISDNSTVILNQSLITSSAVILLIMDGDTTDYYLDLYNVFINEVSGGEWIFIFLSLAVIVFFGAKFRFPNNVILLICILWLVLLSQFLSVSVLTPLIVFMSAVFIGWTLIRVLTR